MRVPNSLDPITEYGTTTSTKCAGHTNQGRTMNETKSKTLPAKHGDYVMATKYSDGDPLDHWAVGFFAGLTSEHYFSPRYDVVDGDGKLFRGNGFRRVKKISAARGEWLVQHAREIEKSGKSVWYFVRCRMEGKNNE